MKRLFSGLCLIYVCYLYVWKVVNLMFMCNIYDSYEWLGFKGMLDYVYMWLLK